MASRGVIATAMIGVAAGVYVRCAPGLSGSGTTSSPFSSLTQARDAIRALPRPLASCPAVYISGDCFGADGSGNVNYALPALTLDSALDSGDALCTIQWTAWPGQPAPRLLGGAPIPDVWGPIDPPILVASLSAMGVANYDIGDLLLPTNILGQCTNNRTQLFVNGASQTLARYPNVMPNGTWAWSLIDSVVDATGAFVYNDTTGRAAPWTVEPEAWGQGFWGVDWAHGYVRFANITLSPNGDGLVTLANDPATLPTYGYAPMARWMIVNARSEVDARGEYYIDRQRGQVSFIPPVAIDGAEVFMSYADVVLAVGGDPATLPGLGTGPGPNGTAPTIKNANDIMQRGTLPGQAIQVVNASAAVVRYVTFSGLEVRYARGSGVIGGAIDHVSFTNVTVANHGRDGMILAGTNITVADAQLFDVGCSALRIYGGDDIHLLSSDNAVQAANVSQFSQFIRSYTPGLSWGGVGMTFTGVELSNAPHSAVLGTGNDATFDQLNVHDVAWEVSDSGAFYSGYSWVKRGNVIVNSTFRNIQHIETFHLGAPSVQAVYLDDEMSGWTVTGSTFDNCMLGVFVGGGRDVVVTNNRFTNVGYATHIDDRGLNWQHASCTYNATYAGRLVQDLYNLNVTQAPYATAYPQLPELLNDRPCVPVNIMIVGNLYCNATNGFIDATANQTATWGDNVSGNTLVC